MTRIAPAVLLSQRQEGILKQQVRAHKTAQQLSIRARIILGAAKGFENIDIAAELGVDVQRVGRWRKRWVVAESQLEEAEHQGASDQDLTTLIKQVLSDNYRSGAPPKFTAEQMTQIIALACEDPRDSGYPVTHWTPKEVAAEAIRRKIIASISVRHVDRFLKGGQSPTA